MIQFLEPGKKLYFLLLSSKIKIEQSPTYLISKHTRTMLYDEICKHEMCTTSVLHCRGFYELIMNQIWIHYDADYCATIIQGDPNQKLLL